MSIVILDYGLGNVGSISNMLKFISCPHSIESSNKEAILDATGLVLPGVGHFQEGMSLLESSGLSEVIKVAVKERGVPMLGICLGMQLMCNYSEEGGVKGLGLIDADVVKFRFGNDKSLKVPHMGWSDVRIERDHQLSNDLIAKSRFYFVHSYFVKCNNPEDIFMSTKHGYEFTSSFLRDNLFGCQFHPEKSHKYGIQLFRNFTKWCG